MEKEYAIGIDLGGTSVKYALIDNEGVFYFQGKLPSKADVSAEAVIGQLVTAINEVKAFAQEKDYKIDGIGIGTPGIVDCTNRIVLGGAENINGWENIHLADRIETETGLPALLGNDANLMGLGETMYGAGQGATHVVFLTVGTGYWRCSSHRRQIVQRLCQPGNGAGTRTSHCQWRTVCLRFCRLSGTLCFHFCFGTPLQSTNNRRRHLLPG